MTSRPTPVVNAATFKSVIQTAVYVLGILGANSAQGWVDTHTAVLIAVGVAVVNFGGDLLAAFHAQQRVTPVEDPKTVDGTPLVPVTVVAAPSAPSAPSVVVAEPMPE